MWSARARTEPRFGDGVGVSKGDAIDTFKYIINVDATGTTETQRSPVAGSGCAATDPNYPESCLWQSIDEPSGWAPIVTQGSRKPWDAEAFFATGEEATVGDAVYKATTDIFFEGVPNQSPNLDTDRWTPFTLDLDPGRYLVSVTADGYKLDGAHFCVETGRPSPAARPRSTARPH